ncbi:acetylornithine deacetylase [Spongiimicrobium sp. 3-5]|uniref:acetylornithine deacetylase n=1 Tax=Spongiimicrobium sp. 3-5 TaxID=3332596 RepID=UPI00397F35F2
MYNHKNIETSIEILGNLVQYPVLGGESNTSIAGYITDYLKKNKISYSTVPNEKGDKMSIHCRIGPNADGGIILSGHTDVVPTEGQPWTKPDFEITRSNGRLYSRGTTDMKGFLACCLTMVPHLKKIPLSKPVYLAFSYDEEVGCLAGPTLIKHIKETYEEKPRFAIIGEPTSMKTIIAEKGVAFFKTQVYGQAAHSSQVRRSVSAIEEATYLTQWLLNKMDGFIAEGNIDNRFDPSYTTIHIGKIKGGTAVNIVADYCEFYWDVRNIPSDSIEKIERSFQEFCLERIREKKKSFPAFNIITTAEFPIVPGLDTPKTDEVVKLVNSFTGKESFETVAFASEAGQFSKEGFSAVLCGPGSMEQGHKADEYIEITEMNKCLHFLDELVSWCKNDKIK